MARTPSAAAHEKALDAAIRLIEERGLERTSMDAIAQESGVSKATLYKHWKDKDALCLEAVDRIREALPEFDSGDTRRDLTDLLKHIARTKKPSRFMKLIPRLMSYASTRPEFGQALRHRSLGGTEEAIGRILNDAIARGDLKPGTDPATAISLLFGPILHRRIMGGAVPAAMPEEVVNSFWSGWSTGRPPQT